MIESLSIAVHDFISRVSMSFSVDETLLPRYAKMLHPGQSLMANMIHDQEDASSIFTLTHFSLPDLILHARHIRARFERARICLCIISLATKVKWRA